TKAHDLRSHANKYEQKWIAALHAAHHKEYKDDKARWQAFVDALEDIVHEYPGDTEAKAFLALHLFWNKSGKALGVTSREAVDSLLARVFEQQPMHPAHHYRIHLWDNKKRTRALDSAAQCGQSAPSIAHMWHMSGHIYSGLKRYEDASWQQEASSRVDHRHMMHDYVLPTEIHNYTHNQEWLVRNLIKTGNITKALGIATNLIEIPRHPQHNSAEKNSSAVARGRTRLLDTLIQFELWQELTDLAETPYLEVDADFGARLRKTRYLAVAQLQLGQPDQAEKQQQTLQTLLEEHQQQLADLNQKSEAAAKEKAESSKTEGDNKTEDDQQPSEQPEDDQAATDQPSTEQADTEKAEPAKDPADKPEGEKAEEEKKDAPVKPLTKKEVQTRIGNLEKALAHLQAVQAQQAGEHQQALTHYKQASDVTKTELARAHLAAGDSEEAEKQAKAAVDAAREEVLPLAVYARILHELNKPEEAKKAFEQMRELSALIDHERSVFADLAPLAKSLGHAENWNREYRHRDDVGERPELETLGPLTWEPVPAPPWTLPSTEQQPLSLADYQGRPVVVIFYLGFGCLHCVEQLQTFAPLRDEFSAAGIDLVAIGSSDLPTLQKAAESYAATNNIPFPLLADPDQKVFSAYRCVDDFEQQPLHGTFLIDGAGQIRWQDLGAEPFTDAKFLLQESQRLLRLPLPGEPREGTAAAG
ncbi:MAG: redoxin domain-containing protein, partial [Pirellulaceae bacterium]